MTIEVATARLVTVHRPCRHRWLESKVTKIIFEETMPFVI